MMLPKQRCLFFCGLLMASMLFFSAMSQDQGTNVTFQTTLIGTELSDIIWCGTARESVLVVTEGGVVYYSNNGGLDWKKLKDVFQRTGLKVSDDEDIGVVNSLMQSPVDPQLVFFLGSEGIHWYTDDCGKTIRALDTGRNIRSFQFHPTKRNWVLASAFTVCDEESDKPCKTSQELYLSQDLGTTWTYLVDYVIQFSWAVQDASFLQTIPEERIIVTQDLRTKISQKIDLWTEQVQMVLSDDFFKTNKAVLKSGQKFLITKSFFFAVKVEDEDTQDVSLYIGDSKAKNYKFQKIRLPTKDKLYERSYIILDTSEDQVFLHINHENVKSKFGDIYISDSTGIRYSVSLHNNVRSNSDLSDFESVMGLEGIYFANVYDAQIIKKVKDDADTDVPTEKTSKKGKGKDTGTKHVNKRIQDLDEYKQTRITFDKGGMWEPLTPPKYDALGENIECEEKDCSLHLHSISNNNFGPFYSTDNSLGLILGTGNVGKYLSNKEDEVNTYLSRNGGLTWYEIKKGSHTYEIGDHGSIIVVASDQKATHSIYYTWNEGISWSTLKISDTPIEISNIIIEPSNTAQKFILYGRTSTSTSDSKGVIKTRKGVLIGIDFSSLHERICELPDRPDDPASDYETWTPNGYLSGSCLMGHQITYSRRKRQAECFNPQEFEKQFNLKNCPCTEEDWECDLGYERKGGGSCLLPKGKEPSYEPPEECDGYYTISNGYRKVAGNTCEGGVNHDAIRFPCPSKIFSKKNGTILLGLALAGLVVWTIMKKGDKFLNLLKRTAYSGKSINRKGFAQLNQDETNDHQLEDHEELSEKLRFDDNDKSIPLENKSNDSSGKRMVERKGLETASKNIPAVNRPQQFQQQQLIDDDEDDIGNFDPRT